MNRIAYAAHGLSTLPGASEPTYVMHFGKHSCGDLHKRDGQGCRATEPGVEPLCAYWDSCPIQPTRWIVQCSLQDLAASVLHLVYPDPTVQRHYESQGTTIRACASSCNDQLSDLCHRNAMPIHDGDCQQRLSR